MCPREEKKYVQQSALCHKRHNKKVERKDYLQVFKLVVNGTNQQVTHSQEEPDYERTFTFPTDEPITAKIFVIDDETQSTMLLAEEY